LWITFYHQSKRYRKSLGLDDTKANRKLAEQRIIPEIVYKLNSGTFFDNQKPKIPTVGEYAEVSFDLHRFDRRPSTQSDYRIAYRLHIEPYFGKKRLDEIKPSDIARWQNKLLETLMPRRVRNIRVVFNTFFEDAINDELIQKNPISRVKVPKIEKVEPKAFTLDEMNKIIQSADGWLQSFCAVGFYTGMRSGEIVGLRWEDIDFSKKEIRVIRSIKMGLISKPKTQNSIRTIDIIDPLMPYLIQQYQRTGSAQSYVFLNKKGEHFYDIKRVRNTHWKRLLQKAGVEYRTIYQMRHTFATLMIEHGEDVLWVANMLGHTDPSMTLKMYAKYRKRDEKKRATFLMDTK